MRLDIFFQIWLYKMLQVFIVVCNLVPLWFIIISLVFFYLCKVLFSGFQFNLKLSFSMLKITQNTVIEPL